MRKILLLLICSLFITNIQAKIFQNTIILSDEGQIIISDPPDYGFVADTTVSGFGTLTYPNGERFVGNFKKGLKHGNGYILFPDGREYYGDFKNDRIDGYGSLTYPNGDKYVGNFKDGKYEGAGTFIPAAGEKKEGIFKENVLIAVNGRQ
ncbi:MAG TPA: hypothetical protein PKN48_05625 [Bacteroidales bacterium]|nr:hypothetical protein [Bacteroidales bacterium]